VLDLGKRLGSRKGDIFLRYYNQYFYRCCTAEGVKVKERGNILRNCSQIFTDAVLGKDFGLRKGGGGMGEVDSFHVKYIVILPAQCSTCKNIGCNTSEKYPLSLTPTFSPSPAPVKKFSCNTSEKYPLSQVQHLSKKTANP
jgi:hypothetical protein